MKGESNSCSRIGPSCVAASMRTVASAFIGFFAPTGADVILDCHKTSFLHRLVVFFGDGKVLSSGDGLLLAFGFVRGHQSLSLAVGDPGLPSLHHVVGRRVRNLSRKRKAQNPLAEVLWCLRELAGVVCVEQDFAF